MEYFHEEQDLPISSCYGLDLKCSEANLLCAPTMKILLEARINFLIAFHCSKANKKLINLSHCTMMVIKIFKKCNLYIMCN